MIPRMAQEQRDRNDKTAQTEGPNWVKKVVLAYTMNPLDGQRIFQGQVSTASLLLMANMQ